MYYYINTYFIPSFTVQKYVHPYIHSYMLKYIHTYIHTYMHVHIHTYLHTYIHTYINTYVHTYIQTDIHYIYRINYPSTKARLCLGKYIVHSLSGSCTVYSARTLYCGRFHPQPNLLENDSNLLDQRQAQKLENFAFVNRYLRKLLLSLHII